MYVISLYDITQVTYKLPMLHVSSKQTNPKQKPVCISENQLLIKEMRLEILHHAENPEAFRAYDFVQRVVADRELLIVRVVELLFLYDGPHTFDDLVARHLGCTHQIGESRRQFVCACVTAAFAAAAALLEELSLSVFFF